MHCNRARSLLGRTALLVTTMGWFACATAQAGFRRGDANGDAVLDISDASFVLGYLFVGTAEPACLDAADSNDDGTVDISDATFTLGFLFLGSAAPPSPGPVTPGPDPTADSLGCGGQSGESTQDYVTSQLSFPTTQEEVNLFAFNLDGDAGGKLDNSLGNVLASVARLGLPLQPQFDKAFEAGRIIVLHRLEAENLLESPVANWRVLVGKDVAPPVDLSGDGEFMVADGAPPAVPVTGKIVAGRFTGGPGAVQIEIAAHPSVSIILDLVGARIEADVSDAGCQNGRIGGGITKDEIDTALIPGLAATFQASVEEDPNGETTQTLLSFYDGNRDGRIDVEDLRSNSLLAGLLAPDVDLLDASGAFHPLADGVKDSLSFGLGFECVGAQFSVPDSE